MKEFVSCNKKLKDRLLRTVPWPRLSLFSTFPPSDSPLQHCPQPGAFIFMAEDGFTAPHLTSMFPGGRRGKDEWAEGILLVNFVFLFRERCLPLSLCLFVLGQNQVTWPPLAGR